MAVLELDGAIKSPKFKELASFKIKRYQMNEEFSVVTDCDGQSMSGLKEDSQAQNIVQILVKIISSYGWQEYLMLWFLFPFQFAR